MPYKSKAQAAYFNIHKKELEKKGVDVNEWNRASKGGVDGSKASSKASKGKKLKEKASSKGKKKKGKKK
jgi:hypothetical protein